MLLIYLSVFILIFVSSVFGLGIAMRRFEKGRRIALRIEHLKHPEKAHIQNRNFIRKQSRWRRSAAFWNWMQKYYGQSGWNLNPTKAIGFALLYSVIGFAIGFFLFRSLNWALIWALLAPPVLFALIIRRKREKRMRSFVVGLSTALDIIVRSLRAGHPLSTSIALVAQEMPEPVGPEFLQLSQELTYGTDFERAMLNLCERVGTDELRLLTVSVSVQRGTGGNLSEVLENLSDVIRERIAMRAKIRAVSSEGRATAWIMAAFPLLLYLLISTLVPTYFDPLWESGYGDIVVTVCAVMTVVGIIVLRKMVRFDF